MSLTRHLKGRNSPIRKFMQTQFPNTKPFLADARKQVRAAYTIHPDEDVPWGVIGMALDYRIRYYFDVTPYNELAAYKGAGILTNAQTATAHAAFGYEWTGNMEDTMHIFDKRTGKTLLWHFPDLNASTSAPDASSIDDFLMLEANNFASSVVKGKIVCSSDGVAPLMSEYQDFFDRLDYFLGRDSPVDTRLEAHQEDTLNRYCIVLALMEQVYRVGPREGNPLVDREIDNMGALLDIADHYWLDDLRELSWEFYDNYNCLLHLPHTLNPTFEGSGDVGGGDADLIVDGVLIDAKTTVKWEINLEWLWQVLGYALLDYSDRYGINGVGLYMARQGILFRWTLDEVIEGLCADKTASVNELRNQFEECVKDLK